MRPRMLVAIKANKNTPMGASIAMYITLHELPLHRRGASKIETQSKQIPQAVQALPVPGFRRAGYLRQEKRPLAGPLIGVLVEW
jgi:hypothetical protein